MHPRLTVPTPLRRYSLLALTALLPAFGFGAGGKTYPINFSVPSTVGEKFLLVSTASQTMQTIVVRSDSASPVQQKSQKRSVRVEAEGEVLAIFPGGGVKKAAFTIKILRAGTDSADTDVVPAGSKVVAEEVGDKATFTVDGQPPGEAEGPLNMVLSILDDGSGSTTQDMLGPKAPQPVGGTWPMGGAQLAKKLKEDFGDAVTCDGTMTLDSTKQVGDQVVTLISGTAQVQIRRSRFPFTSPWVA